MQDREAIPGPKPLPVVGNLFDIDLEHGLQSTIKMADEFLIFATSQALVDELCDESRFHKAVIAGVEKLRMVAHDGLFTAYHGERGWGIAHRILMPAFGPLRIRDMFEDMSDVAQQLCLKWACQGSSISINICDDFTRLTLDTICLCTINFRLNSFYNNENMHLFMNSMLYLLKEADLQSTLPGIANTMCVKAQRHTSKNIKAMRNIARNIIQERKNKPEPVEDLLNTLLNGRYPVTGEGMSDDLIINNIITFLITGHETTSAQNEIDEVIGKAPITVQHLAKLPYIDAIMKESLCMMPTAPVFAVIPKKPEVLGGKWVISPGQSVNLLLPVCLRDQNVFGPDADEFHPERMLEENFSKLLSNLWKPFGNGQRGCIGRAFAWQEAQLVVALVLQTFYLVADDPSYELRIKETLTIKPDSFRVRATLRRGQSATELSRRSRSLSATTSPAWLTLTRNENNQNMAGGQPISFFYGSNSGTCKALAHQLAFTMMARGFTDQKLASLDSAVNNLPKDQPVIIVTTTYDGQPTDDARKFVTWLESGNCSSLQGVSYAVFGCGHQGWTKTFYRIPILIDDLMQKAGATLLPLQPALRETFLLSNSDNAEPLDPSQLQISLSKPTRVGLHQGFIEATVTDVRILTSPWTPEKRHVEFCLPSETTMRPGDHLNVLPVNPPSTVSRVLARFHLAPDHSITINSFNALGLPYATPVSATELFSSYLELSQPVTRNNIKVLASSAPLEEDKQKLLHFHYHYDLLIRNKRVSALDLLKQFHSIPLPLATFISMLPTLRVRMYSLSMAPSFKPSYSSLTFSVVNEPAWNGNGRYLGIRSNYLASLTVGSILYISPRPAKNAFHLPTALLFFGCRGPHQDDLYREELFGFESAVVVKVRRAYSKAPDNYLAQGCRYVQHRLVKEAEAIKNLWALDAIIYVCGSGGMAKEVKATLEKMLETLSEERYITEIF
ncbi:NADPH--cytochrome P450 reductase [Aspergillus alliaceus]|uniref:NADPH--cytochrome P450 reductase n=1 Tax=Petromyces alliaceus TaxID=209559 RepID=A0A5N7C259_PETAA|nr:NADPH--cytochrome P450 reductase [Aspergillus alliaceus]